MSQQVVAGQAQGQAQGPVVEGQDVPQNLETPQGYANLQASLEQGFLNVIARKNLVQKRISQTKNVWNAATGNTDQVQRNNVLRNNCIIVALNSVLTRANKEGLGDYSITNAVSGAFSTGWNWLSRSGKGGKKSRKCRKARRGRKTRR